jgi:hypothetical protein
MVVHSMQPSGPPAGHATAGVLFNTWLAVVCLLL